jgi:hypothetical protein
MAANRRLCVQADRDVNGRELGIERGIHGCQHPGLSMSMEFFAQIHQRLSCSRGK